MANASSKRIAQSNSAALKNLELGLIVVLLSTVVIRFVFSKLTSRPFVPGWKLTTLHLIAVGAMVVVWRWFALIGTPTRDAKGEVRVGDDLAGKGLIELGWDLIYMTWICLVGSALLGNWVWYLYLLVPGFGLYKAFQTARPLLAMFLPGLFGPRAPRDPSAAGTGAAAQDDKQAGESRKQAKLRARMEKGDKRVQQVQMKR